MTSETLGTVETLLESLIEETDESEVHYKLRTALQLLIVHEADVRRLERAAEEDQELAERLRDLGYLG